MKIRTRLTLLLGLITSCFAITSAALGLEVSVNGLRNTQGNIVVCLWRANDQGFPNCAKGQPWKTLSAPASQPLVAFKNLPAGTYAVSMFHDEKLLGRPETNFMGMPLSGVGLANNPSIGPMSPPTFQKGRVDVPATRQLTITAKYLF